MLKSSFLWRLYAGFVGVIVCCALILNFLLSDYIQENNAKALERELFSRGYMLKELVYPFLESGNLEKPNKQTQLQGLMKTLDEKLDSRFTIIMPDGTVIAESRKKLSGIDNHAGRPEIIEAISTGTGKATRYSETVEQNMKYLALAVYDQKDPATLLGVARVALPQKQIQQQQKQLAQYVLAGCILASLVALILGFFFARRVSLPIVALTKSAQAIAEGDYQQRVYLNNRDEIGKLAHAFNFMAASANDRMQRIIEDRNKLATILSGLNEGVIAMDGDHNIIHINQAAAKTLSISASASMGTSVWSTIRIPEIHEVLQQVFTKGGIRQSQVRIPQAHHKDTVIEVYSAALEQSDKANGAILVLHDISELEMLENVRRDFVTNASHELKTPLTAIRGVIETILHDREMERDTLWHFLQRVQNQTDRLVSIVSDLMALSRLESGRNNDYEPVSIKAVLNQSLKSFNSIALEKGSVLSHNIDSIHEDSSKVRGDAHALGQLFDNLIDNAIKYTPENGRIHVSVEALKDNDSDFLQIKVSDNGLGISEADRNRIFERFYRVDKGRSRELGGTGLGLAISKHIVEQHGGNIMLDSELGQGSTFTIRLPLI